MKAATKAAIAAAKRAHKAGNKFARYDALRLARDAGAKPPEWAVDAVLEDGERASYIKMRSEGPKGNGRPRLLPEDKLLRIGLHWMNVNGRAEKGKKLYVFEEVAKELDAGCEETVRKDYYAAKKINRSRRRPYFSETVRLAMKRFSGLDPKDFPGAELFWPDKKK